MKYSEFKREIEAVGFNTKTINNRIEVWDNYGERLLYVYMIYDFSVCTDSPKFDELDEEIKKELFYLAVELASTPLDEREDERKYRLRIPFMNDMGYLNIEEAEGIYYLSTKEESDLFRTKFTESEIAELKAKHNLDSFVLEEVKENE